MTGVSLLCISNGGLSWAEQRVPSGIAALLVATISLWLVILDWLRPRGTRPGAHVFVGLVMGFAGLALLVGPANLGGSRRIDLVGTGVLLTGSFIMGMRVVVFEAAGHARIAAAGGGDAKPGRRRGAVGCGDSFGGSSHAAFHHDFGAFLDGASLPSGVWIGDWVHGLPVHSQKQHGFKGGDVCVC